MKQVDESIARTAVVVLSLCVCAMTTAAAAERPSAPGKLVLVAHHVTATVENIDRAVAWYHDVLGFEIAERGEHGPQIRYAELKITGFGVGLVQFPGTARVEAAGRPSRAIWLHIVFAVPDIAKTKRVLEQRGVMPRAAERDGHIMALTFKDSEGNEIEIVPATP